MIPVVSLVALFLGLSVVIVFVLVAGKSLLTNPPNGTTIAFAVNCMDLRFVKTTHSFLRGKYGYNAYDSFVAPGPAASLGKTTNRVTQTNTNLYPLGVTVANALLLDGQNAAIVDPVFYNAFIRAATISKLVNTSEVLVLVEHEDCGYYTALAGGTVPASYKDSQLANLRTVKIQLLRDQAPLFTNGIKLYWVSLHGDIEEVV